MILMIRPYRGGDLADLMRLYRDAIISIGAEYYTSEQVQAWSGFADDASAFQAWLGESSVFVATDGGREILGFAGLEETGRIASLFVTPGHMRQGIGSALLDHLLGVAMRRGIEHLSTDASEFSRPLFEKAGFTVKNLEQTSFNGVSFSRYQMLLESQNLR